MAESAAGIETFTFNLDVHIPPFILEAPDESIEITQGRQIMINCPADGYPLPEVYWLKDGQFFNGNSVLEITAVRPDDSGLYTCVAKSRAGVDEVNVKISVNVPPSIEGDSTSSQHEKSFGETITFDCSVENVFPPPVIKWYKDGESATSWSWSKQLEFSSNGQFLNIPDIRKYHDGEWSCTITNIAGSARKVHNLSVLLPPVIKNSRKHKTHTVVEYSSLEIFCKIAEANPEAIKVWRFNEAVIGSMNSTEVIGESINREKYVMDPQRQSLTVHNIEVEDFGEIICTASNAIGFARKIDKILVHSFPFIETVFNKTKTLLIGSSFYLSCEAGGIPTPKINWYIDGEEITNDANYARVITYPENTLTIPRISAQDSGSYSCSATNVLGIVNKTTTLIVTAKPIIDIIDESKFIVVQGEVIEIPCHASGVPPPEVYWLSSKSGDKKYETPLVITDANYETDADNYTCIAKNSAGDIKWDIQIEVHVPPIVSAKDDAPLEVTTVVGKSILFECQVNEGVYPAPRIYWEAQSTNYRIMSKTNLYISDARIEDAGEYICFAENSVGYSNVTFELKVHSIPKISGLQPTYIGIEGHKLTITPWIEGHPFPTISWNKLDSDGNHANPDIINPNQLESEFGVLVFESLSPSSNGVYEITAQNQAGNVTELVEVSCMIPPTITFSDKAALNATEDSEVELIWTITGFPTPTVSFLYNGQVLNSKEDGSRIVDYGNNTAKVHIKKLKFTDDGRYQITAVNTAGKSFRIVDLSVLSIPIIVQGPKTQRLIEGDTVILNCQAHGKPMPDITWLFEDKLIPSIFYSGNVSGYSALTIRNSNKSGNYTCRATNQVDSTISIAEVTFVSLPSVDSSKGFTDKELEQGFSMNVNKVGESTEFKCPFDYNPLPEYTWLKNNQVVSNTTSKRAKITSSGSILTIKNLDKSDEGEYVCKAENAAGMKSFSP